MIKKVEHEKEKPAEEAPAPEPEKDRGGNGGAWKLALITALFASVISPIVVAVIASSTKTQEWERQDKVAAALIVSDKARLEVQKGVEAKLETIHKLVNSNLTAALQAEYDARSAELVTLIELTELKAASGKPALGETVSRIAATRTAVAKLKAVLEARAAEQSAIDAAAEASANKPVPVPTKVEIVGTDKPVPVTIKPEGTK